MFKCKIFGESDVGVCAMHTVHACVGADLDKEKWCWSYLLVITTTSAQSNHNIDKNTYSELIAITIF